MPQTFDARSSVRPATALRSEASLVADARRGDARAFEELYSRYRPRICAFILSRVHDHGRAEDIAQEVFISALRQLRATDREIVLRPWLYTIAKNACVDEFRRGERGTALPVGSDDDLALAQASTLSLVPTPDDAIESKQRLDDLRGAFGGLSDTHRRLLVMREFEGRSYDEIGDQLGMSRQMVESGLFRARRKLGAEYDELASGRRCEQIADAIVAGTFETAERLGVKQRRRAIRHLSHCGTCRHHAMMANVDQTLLKPRSIADKLAALLPLGSWRTLWPHAHSGAGSAAGGGKAAGALGASAQAVGPAAAGSSIGMGTAAVAVAVVAIAGAGGGVALTDGHSSHASPPARVSRAPSGTAAHGSGGTAVQPSRPGPAAHPAVAVGGMSASSARRTALALHARKLVSATKTGGSVHGIADSSAGGGGAGTAIGGGGGSTGGGSTGAGKGGGGDNGNNTVGRTGTTVDGAVSKSGSAVGNTVSQTGNAVGNTVSQTGNAVGNTVSQTGDAVGNTVGQTGNAVGNTVGTVAPGVGTAVSGVTSTGGNTVSGATGAVGDTVAQTGSAVGGTVAQTGDAVGSTVGQTGNVVGNTVTGVTGAVGGALGGH